MQKLIEEFKAYLHKMHAYEHALGVMNYDFETAMPKGASEEYAQTMGILGEEYYRLQTAPAFKDMIEP